MNRFKFFKIFCFLLSIAAVLYFPIKKIIKYEFSPAEVYDFKVTGADPYDPARGHYLALRVYPEKAAKKVRYLTEKYAVITAGEDGFAAVSDIIDKPDGRPCVKLNKTYGANIRYPFNRFYINEDLAAEAEQILRDAERTKKMCLLRVRVYDDGASSVDDLQIDGKSIRKLAAESLKKKKLAK